MRHIVLYIIILALVGGILILGSSLNKSVSFNKETQKGDKSMIEKVIKSDKESNKKA